MMVLWILFHEIWQLLQFRSLYSYCDAFLCSEGGRIAEPLEGTDSCCAETRGYVLLVRACIPYSAIGLPVIILRLRYCV